jgi:chitodextrinase
MIAYNNEYGNTYYSSFTGNLSAITLPGAVVGFTTSKLAPNSLTFSWSKNSSADGYKLQQMKNGVWVTIKDIASNTTTSYTATGLSPATTYNFRMIAYNNEYGNTYYSAFTDKLSATTRPSDMQNFRVGGKTASVIRLNWDKNTTAHGYIIEQYKDGKWERVAKLVGNETTTYRVTGLASNTTYKFRMKAYIMAGNVGIYSALSSTISVATDI